MALSTKLLTARELKVFDSAWPAIEGRITETARCSTTADLLPDRGWVRAQVGSSVIVCMDGTIPHGGAVFRGDGRITWLLCDPARYVEVARLLIPAVTVAAGARAWGIMSQPGPRQVLLDAGVVVVRTDKPWLPAGEVVMAA